MIGGMFILFLVLLLLNVPIAFSLGASSLFYLLTSNMNVAVLHSCGQQRYGTERKLYTYFG